MTKKKRVHVEDAYSCESVWIAAPYARYSKFYDKMA